MSSQNHKEACYKLDRFANRKKWVSKAHLPWPGLDHIFIWLAPAPPMRPSLPSLRPRTCVGPLPRWEPTREYLTCEGTPSFNLGIMKVMSTWIFVVLTGYCHIGSQWGRVPTHVRAGRPGSEGGVAPNQMKMWSSPGASTLGSMPTFFCGASHMVATPWGPARTQPAWLVQGPQCWCLPSGALKTTSKWTPTG